MAQGIKRGAVVRVARNRGKAIVMRFERPSRYTKAYGPHVLVCYSQRKTAVVVPESADDLTPIGKTKRMPAVCRQALDELIESRRLQRRAAPQLG